MGAIFPRQLKTEQMRIAAPLQLTQEPARSTADIKNACFLADVFRNKCRLTLIDSLHWSREYKGRSLIARQHRVVIRKRHGFLDVARVEEPTRGTRTDIVCTKRHDGSSGRKITPKDVTRLFCWRITAGTRRAQNLHFFSLFPVDRSSTSGIIIFSASSSRERNGAISSRGGEKSEPSASRFVADFGSNG